jgi:pimeloyl-ACP methyl ester carboxylesterase
MSPARNGPLEVRRMAGHRGLELAVHFFGPPRPDAPLVLLLHGFLDAGGTWDLVAEALVARGLSVVAPDLRGFGQSAWVGRGGYYHFPDYVADIALVVEALAPARLVLVGHSLGGTVACLYAGARPERVERLILLEGMGPPAMAPELGVTQLRKWLDQAASPPEPKPLASHDDALRRLALHHPRISREVLASRLEHLLHERDGALTWRHDPLHRTTAPSRFDVTTFRAFLAEIRCPVRFVSGGETGWHPPDEAERLASLPAPPDVVLLPDAGHMMHWSRPAKTANAIADFVL